MYHVKSTGGKGNNPVLFLLGDLMNMPLSDASGMFIMTSSDTRIPPSAKARFPA